MHNVSPSQTPHNLVVGLDRIPKERLSVVRVAMCVVVHVSGEKLSMKSMKAMTTFTRTYTHTSSAGARCFQPSYTYYSRQLAGESGASWFIVNIDAQTHTHTYIHARTAHTNAHAGSSAHLKVHQHAERNSGVIVWSDDDDSICVFLVANRARLNANQPATKPSPVIASAVTDRFGGGG